MIPLMLPMTPALFLFALATLMPVVAQATGDAGSASPKTAHITRDTPAPTRFVADGTTIVDRKTDKPVYLRGMGYSPYLIGETPLIDLWRSLEHELPPEGPAGFCRARAALRSASPRAPC